MDLGGLRPLFLSKETLGQWSQSLRRSKLELAEPFGQVLVTSRNMGLVSLSFGTSCLTIHLFIPQRVNKLLLSGMPLG